MPRARTIKHSFFMNTDLSEIEPLGRLLFAGLWTISDKAGRLPDNPKRIKAETLPYDDCDVDDLLNALQSGGFITRYEVDGKRFIEVDNFPKHQHCHAKEPESTIPAPDKTGASQGQKRLLTVISNLESVISNPITRTPDASGSEWMVESFKRFWTVYPKREAKINAEKAWRKLSPDAELVERIIVDVKVRKEAPQWTKNKGEFIPLPATYLNGRRWEDETERDTRPPNPYPDEYEWDEGNGEWRPAHLVGWANPG